MWSGTEPQIEEARSVLLNPAARSRQGRQSDAQAPPTSENPGGLETTHVKMENQGLSGSDPTARAPLISAQHAAHLRRLKAGMCF